MSKTLILDALYNKIAQARILSVEESKILYEIIRKEILIKGE